MSDLGDHLEKSPKNCRRFMEETIIVNMISLNFHKMNKRRQIKYFKKLLRRMKKQL